MTSYLIILACMSILSRTRMQVYVHYVGAISKEVKDVKPPVEPGSPGFSHFPSVERKQEKPLFSFGSVANGTPTKSVPNSDCPTKPFCITPEGPSNSEKSLVSQVQKTSDETSITATPEDTKINVAKPAQESTGAVTFSFKPKSATESNQSVLSSQSFKFTPKNDTALDTSASVVTSVDADEGMDDDGGAAVPSQKNDSIFGGGFMRSLFESS
uniref:Zgc: n=1 Tax=Angiostrongylus cantonensis TaxID=6313 RepID=A0A0K0DN47_ANGCA